MRFVKLSVVCITVIIIYSTMSGSMVNGATFFPEDGHLPGIEALGYTSAQDYFSSEGSNTSYHVVVYGKSMEISGYIPGMRLDIYKFDTDEVGFYEYEKVLDLIRWKDDIDYVDKYSDQPSFTWIENSSSDDETALAYSFIDYFYHYDSPDAELDPFDAKLDESNRIATGRYVILADPYVIKIVIDEVPAVEFNSIKNILLSYAESLTVPVNPPTPTESTTVPVADNEVHDLDVYITYKDEVIEELPSNNQHIIIGIFDSEGQYIESFNAITDDKGVAKFGFPYPLDAGYTVKVAPVLEYRQNEDQPFLIVSDAEVNSEQAIVLDCGDVIVNQKEDLTIRCHLEDAQLLNTENHGQSALDYIQYYIRLKLATEFYKEVISHTPTQALPIRLILNVPDATGTVGYVKFDEDADIYITSQFSSRRSPYFPSIVYHELSHYMMYDMYDTKFPYTAGSVNHRGYMNPSTSDSFAEGFAFFMEGYLEGAIDKRSTAVEGPLDINYIAWESGGKAEPHAFASLLYDLVDGDGQTNKDDDSISKLGIWKEISEVNNTVADFYKKIISSNPSKKSQIDQVFIDHGFYAQLEESVVGAGEYNFGEAFIDEGSMNGIYDPGEKYIDFYSVYDQGEAYQVYKEGASVGNAAYRSNMTRERMVSFPGQFIKVNSEQKYYDVKVGFSDAPHLNYVTRAQNVDGKIYVHIPPKAYDATISIKAEDDDSEYNELLIKSSDFYSKELEAMTLGYFYEHNFDDDMVEDVVRNDVDSDDLVEDWMDEDLYGSNTVVHFEKIIMALVYGLIGIIVVFVILVRIRKKPKTEEGMITQVQSASVENKSRFDTTKDEKWTCKCGNSNDGKFCNTCGEQKPTDAPVKLHCSNCGELREPMSKFCAACGQKHAGDR